MLRSVVKKIGVVIQAVVVPLLLASVYWHLPNNEIGMVERLTEGELDKATMFMSDVSK